MSHNCGNWGRREHNVAFIIMVKFFFYFSFFSYNFIQFLSSPPILPPSQGLASGKGEWWRPEPASKMQQAAGLVKIPCSSIYGRVQSVACICYLNKRALELEGRCSPRSCWLLKPDVLFLIRPVYDRFHKCFMRPWWLHGWAGWWQLPPTLCIIDKRSKTRFTTLIRSDG